LGVTFCVM
jgi:hypothetical protein